MLMKLLFRDNIDNGIKLFFFFFNENIFFLEKSYSNNVNEVEMDALLSGGQGNVSVLKKEGIENDLRKNQDGLVIQHSTSLIENWWSACQLPVFIIIFAIVIVLAIVCVVSIQRNKKL